MKLEYIYDKGLCLDKEVASVKINEPFYTIDEFISNVEAFF